MVNINMSSLNRIFTRNMLKQFINGEYCDAYNYAVNKFTTDYISKKNKVIIEEFYNNLRKNYRNEYFYKNTLFNKLLLGVHSVNTTTGLTEVSISKSKADFIMINGKANVYEIKTELDNLERLKFQILDYYKAFDHVTVVSYENNLMNIQDIIRQLDRPVGIRVIRKNGSIGEIKKTERFHKDLDKEVIFKILRKYEYESILNSYYGYIPEVSQFDHYTVCKNMFYDIPLIDSYPLFLKVLKKRVDIDSNNLKMIPYELKFLAYFMGLSDSDFLKLNRFLECVYTGG